MPRAPLWAAVAALVLFAGCETASVVDDDTAPDLNTTLADEGTSPELVLKVKRLVATYCHKAWYRNDFSLNQEQKIEAVDVLDIDYSTLFRWSRATVVLRGTVRSVVFHPFSNSIICSEQRFARNFSSMEFRFYETIAEFETATGEAWAR